jgi:hypothetical protein
VQYRNLLWNMGNIFASVTANGGEDSDLLVYDDVSLG